MARMARKISQSGFYHVVFRGVNRQHLFEEDKDYIKIVAILSSLKKEMQFEINAYCLMSNHVHILLKEKVLGDISLIMKRLLTKYARWFNLKYSRSGALISNRYKSQPVEVDEYFLCGIRYIHQNPLKANMVQNIDEYPWSSYREYITEKEIITDRKFVMELIPKEVLIEFHQKEEKERFEISDKMKIDEGEIRRSIIKKTGKEPNEIGQLKREERNLILKELRKEYSIRQLERVTGISRGVIVRCDK